MSPRALVLVHLETEGVGTLGQWLPAAGVELVELRLHEGDPAPSELPAGCDALVVMGGAMGVDDADRLPWLREEMDLIRRTAAAGAPVLGVCLGAQLLAAATGGRVERGRRGPEVGASVVHLADGATTDRLLAGVPTVAEVVQWHWDAVAELPPDAVLLAGSPAYPHQAFRVDELAWGLQFHVETTPEMVARWAAHDAAALAAAGLDSGIAEAGAAAATPALERIWRPVVARFADLVRG